MSIATRCATIAPEHVPPQYSGMSYEEASREGGRLIADANQTGNWHTITDSLVALRQIMDLHHPPRALP